MKRFFWACLAIVAVVVGRNLSGAVHEVGHALATWAVGGQVYHMQPWIFLGRTHTQISNMSDSKAAGREVWAENIVAQCGSEEVIRRI
jgi:hypothetical protein